MAEQQQSSSGATKFVTDFFTGLAAKAITTPLTYPLHRGVTLLQVEGANPALGTPARPYAGGFFGLFGAIGQTSADLGFTANYRGVSMAIVAPVIVSPINFAIKDRVKSIMPKYSSKTDFWAFFASRRTRRRMLSA